MCLFPKSGVLSIQGNIQFQLTSEVDAATPVFTLTCTSTGGPATTVSWQRDGVVVSRGTTELTDTVTATYTSTLTVTGRETGSYSCVVANSRSTATSQMLLLQGEFGIDTSHCNWFINNIRIVWISFCKLIVAFND